MTQQQWESHALHRAQVVKDHGQWIGLFDNDGEPLFDCPPALNVKSPETKNALVSGLFSFPVQDEVGELHPLVNELLAENLGRVDAEGKMLFVTDETRFIGLQRENYFRFFEVTHTVARGGAQAPSVVEANCIDELSFLARIPAMTAPTTWTGKWFTFERDWAGPENAGVMFDQPRDLQDIKMVTVADGATIGGDAESTIRRLIKESLEAAFRAVGVDDPPIVVSPMSSGVKSPQLMIRPQDNALWDEVAALALSAGVNVQCRMWLPGMKQPLGLSLSKPTFVVTVLQGGEVKNG